MKLVEITQLQEPIMEGSLESLIAGFALWLSSNTPYKIPDLPEPVIIPQEQLNNLAKEQQSFNSTHANPKALCINGKIYMSDQLDLNSDITKSIAIHELTHWAQNGCNPSMSATQRANDEREAYEIQNKYLQSIHSPSRVGGFGVDD